MPQSNQPPFDRYVQEIMAHLHALPAVQRQDIVAELQAHLHDAAAEQDRSPDDPALQRIVIERLGTSRQVGQDFARTHRVPTAARGWYALGGAGALLSATLFVAAIVSLLAGSGEEAIEFFVAISPLALLPVVIALYQIYRWVVPHWSMAALVVGGAPFASIAAMLLASRFDVLTPSVAGAIQLSMLALVGIWLILVGHIARCVRASMPAALTWLGNVLGISWLIVLGSTAANMLYPDVVRGASSLMLVTILLLGFCHPVWALWLGGILMRGALRRSQRS